MQPDPLNDSLYTLQHVMLIKPKALYLPFSTQKLFFAPNGYDSHCYKTFVYKRCCESDLIGRCCMREDVELLRAAIQFDSIVVMCRVE